MIPGPVEFWMGSPESDPDGTAVEKPQHRRKIPRSFAIATKEVTVTEFLRFLRANPEVADQFFDGEGRTAEFLKRYSPAEDGPIIAASWYMAAAYCNWLSRQEGLPEAEWCYPKDLSKIRPGMVMEEGYLKRKGYRLPTEAEWEYACRAGAVTTRYYGRAEVLVGKYAWYQENSGEHAHPVGRLRPNDLGLFDMLGNVGSGVRMTTRAIPKERWGRWWWTSKVRTIRTRWAAWSVAKVTALVRHSCVLRCAPATGRRTNSATSACAWPGLAIDPRSGGSCGALV